ncbi:MAG: SCO family protein [Mycobacteriales bacterium]
MKRALLAVLLLGLTACGGHSGTKAVALGYHGVEPDPQPTRPAFVLTDLTGARYDFHAETKGRPTFLYFGYTHCPDECPTAMADIAIALRKATADVRKRAVVVFVTTDPKRDTPAVLRRWLDQFSTDFVGLLGTAQEIARAETAAGVEIAEPGPAIPTLPGRPDAHPTEPGAPISHKHSGPLGYSVSHSAVILAYDAADRLPVLYPGGVTPADIANDLPLLLDPARAH